MASSTTFLLRTQRNQLYELIQQNGFSPDAFTLEDSLETGARLTHNPTGFFLDLKATQEGKEGKEARFSPDFTYGSNPARYGHRNADSWYWVKSLAGHWLSWVYQEWAAPDLWAPRPIPALPVPRRRTRNRMPS